MDTYKYINELEIFRLAAATSVAVNNPKGVIKLEPGYRDQVDLDDVHPMIRGSLGR